MPEVIKLDNKISFHAYESLADVSAEWDSIVQEVGIFFSSAFLTAVENAPPSGLRNRYLFVYENNKISGVLSCQLQSFHAAESIKFKSKGNFVGKFGNELKSRVSQLINFEGIVCGSVLLTGMYAYHFLEKQGHKKEFLLAEKIMESYRLHLNKNGHKLKVIFLKDYYAEHSMRANNIQESAYQEFSVQPNMILQLKPEWRSYEDYLSSFQSKYRVRAKRARKKFQGIERRELSYEEIATYNSEIYRLYKNIVDHINFNLFFLHKDLNLLMH